MVVKRPDLDGIMQLRSGLRFVIVFLGGVLLDGASFGSAERIVILSGILNRNVKTLNLRSLSDINLTLRGDGRGTITFGPAHPMSWWYAGAWWPRSGKYATPGFEMIEDARAVYVQIRQAQKRGLENN
jgi:hypothetical protein